MCASDADEQAALKFFADHGFAQLPAEQPQGQLHIICTFATLLRLANILTFFSMKYPGHLTHLPPAHRFVTTSPHNRLRASRVCDAYCEKDSGQCLVSGKKRFLSRNVLEDTDGCFARASARGDEATHPSTSRCGSRAALAFC